MHYCDLALYDWCFALLFQVETVPSQARATWHEEEWQGEYGSEYQLDLSFIFVILSSLGQSASPLLIKTVLIIVSVFPAAAATWTQEHLSPSLELSTDRTSWCRVAGCRVELLVDVIDRSVYGGGGDHSRGSYHEESGHLGFVHVFK